MKKTAWVLVLIIVLLAAGCSSNNAVESNNAGSNNNVVAGNNAEASGATEASDAADKGDLTIVYPAFLNETGDVEGMTAEAKEAGATNITENSDGSVTATISQENLDKLLDKYHSELSAIIEDAQSEGNSTSIKDLVYDKDKLQNYSITVDKAAYESEESPDGLIIFGLAMQSMMYQVYSGVVGEDIKITFNMIDASTGETFETSVFPEATSAQ
jgi:hypothetical protein